MPTPLCTKHSLQHTTMPAGAAHGAAAPLLGDVVLGLHEALRHVDVLPDFHCAIHRQGAGHHHHEDLGGVASTNLVNMSS